MSHEIEINEGNIDGYGTTYKNRKCFDVVISGERYRELQEIARDQDIDENEALSRVIIEGFDS